MFPSSPSDPDPFNVPTSSSISEELLRLLQADPATRDVTSTEGRRLAILAKIDPRTRDISMEEGIGLLVNNDALYGAFQKATVDKTWETVAGAQLTCHSLTLRSELHVYRQTCLRSYARHRRKCQRLRRARTVCTCGSPSGLRQNAEHHKQQHSHHGLIRIRAPPTMFSGSTSLIIPRGMSSSIPHSVRLSNRPGRASPDVSTS